MATQTQRRETTRAKILEAAASLFSSAGFEATSVDQIVARADVAKGTFYQHFETKLDVATALGRHSMRDAYEQTLKSIERGAAPIPLLHRYYARLCEHFEQHRQLAEPVLRHQLHRAAAGEDDGGGTTRSVVAALIRSAQERGELRRGVDPAEAAQLVAGAFTQAVFTWLADPRVNLRKRVRAFTDIVLYGTLSKE